MSTDSPLVGVRTRTVLLLSTHVALLLVLVVPAVPFDLRIVSLLIGFETALIGKSVADRFSGKSITVSWGDGSERGLGGGEADDAHSRRRD